MGPFWNHGCTAPVVLSGIRPEDVLIRRPTECEPR